VSGVFFRFVLSAAVAAWALDAAAQDRSTFSDTDYESPATYSSERAAPPIPESYDSYVADPSESYVTEGDDFSEPEAPRESHAQRDSEPACREYYPVGAAGDRSGTLCEQPDGSLRIVTAPAEPPRRNTAALDAPSQYCREYQQTIMDDGSPRTAYGKACWQRDGSWQIVSAPALAAVPDERATVRSRASSYAPPKGWNTPASALPAQPQRRAYADATPTRRPPTYRQSESRLKLPEFYFGNLFGWIPDARHDNGKHKGRDRYED
jgi:hypothetical protein